MPNINTLALQFVKKYIDRETSFVGDREIVKIARNFIGYSPTTMSSQIANVLDKALLIAKNQYGLPQTNNRGEKKKRVTSSEHILSRSCFNFLSTVVREMFTKEEYEKFVSRYAEAAALRRKVGIRFTPDDRELELYQKYEDGSLSIEKIQEILNINQRSKAMERMGRVYVFKKEQSRSQK